MKRLRDLATGGIEAVPPGEFEALAVNAVPRRLSRVTLDARCSSSSRTALELVDVRDAVPTTLATEIVSLFGQELGDVLSASEPVDGAALAQRLLRSVEQRELTDDEWFRRGYVRVDSNA